MNLDVYDKARLEFIEWASIDKNIIPFEFGEVGVKGVSDLDLGVVLKDIPLINFQDHLDAFPKSISKIMNGGTLMVFPKKIFKNINFIDDVNISFLKDSFLLAELSKEEEMIVQIIQVIEWFPERILCLFKDKINGFQNPKRSLAFLYSFCYSLKKIQALSKNHTLMNNFIKEIYQLRLNWKSFNDFEKIENIDRFYNKAFSLIQTSIDLYINIPLIKNLSKKIENLECSTFNLHSNVYIKGTKKNIYKVFKDSTKNNITIEVPNVFLYNYIKYSNYKDSSLSTLIAKRFEQKIPLNVPSAEETIFADILKKRFLFMDECFNFIKTLELKKGLFKFGWYL